MAWNLILLFLLKNKMQQMYWGLWHSKGVSLCLLQEYTGIFVLECCLVSVLPISSEQCHGPVEILFLGSEEVFLLEFLTYLLELTHGLQGQKSCWTGAHVRYVFHPSEKNVKTQNQSVGLITTFSFNVAFRTRSCDVLFIFLLLWCHPIMINQYCFQGRSSSQNR